VTSIARLDQGCSEARLWTAEVFEIRNFGRRDCKALYGGSALVVTTLVAVMVAQSLLLTMIVNSIAEAIYERANASSRPIS
jgi:hypothetical protein